MENNKMTILDKVMVGLATAKIIATGLTLVAVIKEYIDDKKEEK